MPRSIIRTLLVCSCLIILSIQPSISEARSLSISSSSDGSGNSLVELDASRYTLAGPQLASQDWIAVSVNNPIVTIYKSSCQVLEKNLNTLTQLELSLLQQTRSQVSSSGVHQSTNSGSTSYSSSSSYSSNSYSSNSGSITNNSNNKYTYSGSMLPETISSVIRENNVVSFVYSNNPSKSIIMKPVSCLDSSERQILANIEQVMEQSSQQMQNNMNHMQQSIHDNMQSFQQQMSHNMQEMSRQMSQSFGNGFPFYNMDNNYGYMNPFNGYQQQQQFGYGYPDYGYSALNYY